MPAATGGTSSLTVVSSLGARTTYRTHIFTSSGNLTVSEGGTVEYLVVGGGGGGGTTMGGGGGGGGYLAGNVTLSAGTYTITVGAGGTGSPAGYSTTRGSTGGSSAIHPANTKNFSYIFDGSGDYITAPYSTTNYDWWTTDYTIEAWIYPITLSGWSATSAQVSLVGNKTVDGTANYWCFGINTSGQVCFYYWNGSQIVVTSTATVTAQAWSHIAMTKTSSGITLFVNGVAQTTTAISGTPQSSASYPMNIGVWNGSYITGAVSNLRIVKGTAVYTGSFTPSTTPLTAITNTTLLTCQDATIVDNSTVAATFTTYSNVTGSHFNPFTGLGAAGGGGGASNYETNAYPAAWGGSGGGVAGHSSTTNGLGVTGQGFAGGTSGGSYYPGGGGGAGGAGSNTPGNGGVGRQNAILGTNYYWAGGGGGCGYSGNSGNGGLGGGGGGAPKVNTGGLGGTGGYNLGLDAAVGTLGSQTNVAGGAGGVNTGGGGGGGSHYNATNPGGTGGSGIVVVRYVVSSESSGSGGLGGPNAGGGGGAGNDGYVGRTIPYAVKIFTSSANLVVNSSSTVEYLIVGGGGGGGSDMGGGGGGGGYLAGTTTLSAGTYLVTVGAGGTGGPAGTDQIRARNGNDSAIQPYANIVNDNFYSYYFDAGDDILSLASNSAFDIGSNDACVELWFWMFRSDGTYHTFNGQNSSTGSTIRIAYNSNNLYYTINNDTIRGNFTVSPQTWYHVVVTYTGGTAKFFVNGILRDVATGLGTIPARAETYFIGSEDGIWMNGYLSNFRFCNGGIPTDYQTASTTVGAQIFTVPTAPLTTTSQGATAAHVKILTCQSSTVKDNSPNNFSITKGGDVTPTRFTPFETLVALGGGGGASDHSGPGASSTASSGGSGGGASGNNANAGYGRAGQGNNGGQSAGAWYPGGGGGAGGAGSTNPATGGNGVQNAILGTSYYWAAGGGGAGYSGNPGNGGLGGGGGGAPKQSSTVGIAGTGGYNAGTDATSGSLNSQTNVPGGNGGTNTGSGGGGGSHYVAPNSGGSGGSGVVIIKYRTDEASISTGISGVTTLTVNQLDTNYGGGSGANGAGIYSGSAGTLFGGGGGASSTTRGGGGGGIGVFGVRDGVALGGTGDGGDGQAGIFGYAGSNGNGGLYGGGGGGTTYSTLDPSVGNGANGALVIFWQGAVLQYPTVIQANNLTAYGTLGNTNSGSLTSGVTLESLESGVSPNSQTLLTLEVKSQSLPTANSNLGILTDTIANANIRIPLSLTSITVKPTITSVNNIAVQELQIITYRPDDEMMLVTVQNTGGYTNSTQRIDRITDENDPRKIKAYLLNYIVGVTGEDNDIIQTQIWY